MNMFKKTMLLGASCMTVVAISAPQEGSATPVFARQTSQSCSACHFQRFPLLNAYGRTFKANGYTQVGKQGTIEDTNLSTPVILNAGLVTKFRYQKRNGTAKTLTSAGELNAGQFQIPDEAFLSLGGRVAKNIGFQAEISLLEPAFIAGFKVPFVFPANDFTFSAVPFYTDAQGAAYGFELLNTGALRFSRAFEHRSETSAQQYLGTAEKATGLALVAHHKYGYISYTPYINSNDLKFSSGSFLSYIRGVVTPEKVGDWDLAAGVQIWTGNSSYTVLNEAVTPAVAVPNVAHSDAWAVDAQAQGKVADLPLGVYVTYGSAAKSVVGQANSFNSSLLASKNALTIATEFGVIPNKLSIGAAYRSASKGTVADYTDDAITLAANYQFSKNLVLQVNHSFYSGDQADADVLAGKGDQQTTVMFYSAF
jgi:hypothetical protein